MGIKGLWKVSSNHVKQKGSRRTDLTQIISPACEIWPLREFTVMEGFRRGLEQGSEPALMKIGVGWQVRHGADTIFNILDLRAIAHTSCQYVDVRGMCCLPAQPRRCRTKSRASHALLPAHWAT
jgi:hypothetical protein